MYCITTTTHLKVFNMLLHQVSLLELDHWTTNCVQVSEV